MYHLYTFFTPSPHLPYASLISCCVNPSRRPTSPRSGLTHPASPYHAPIPPPRPHPPTPPHPAPPPRHPNPTSSTLPQLTQNNRTPIPSRTPRPTLPQTTPPPHSQLLELWTCHHRTPPRGKLVVQPCRRSAEPRKRKTRRSQHALTICIDRLRCLGGSPRLDIHGYDVRMIVPATTP